MVSASGEWTSNSSFIFEFLLQLHSYWPQIHLSLMCGKMNLMYPSFILHLHFKVASNSLICDVW